MRSIHTPDCPSSNAEHRQRATVTVAATILLAGVSGYIHADQAAGHAVSKTQRAERMSGRVVIRFQDATIDPATRQRMKALGRTIQSRPMHDLVAKVQDAHAFTDVCPLFSAVEAPGRRRQIAHRALVPQLGTFYVATGPPKADLDVLIAQLNADPRIAHAWQDRAIAAHLDPVDPHYEQQWAIQRMRVDEAWEAFPEDNPGEGVVVAVLDSGIDAHPDLAANVWTNNEEIAGNGIDDDENGFIDDTRGWNFAEESNDTLDRGGHGTFVAGIVAATSNEIGIVGIVPSAKVMAVGVLRDDGGGNASHLAQGIQYAVDNEARILVISLGGMGEAPSDVVSAIEYALANDVHVVAAAGNDGTTDVHFPANIEGVLAISALNSDGTIRTSSNFGTEIVLTAPGGRIWSLLSSTTDPAFTQYVRFDAVDPLVAIGAGTSMAAPQVAGVLALIEGYFGPMSPSIMLDHLAATAQDLGDPGRDEQFGYGMPDALAALTTFPRGAVQPLIIAPAPQWIPRIYQNKVVWTDLRGPSSNIRMYDLSTNEETIITNDEFNQGVGDIYENLVLFGDARGAFLYDIAEAQTTPISSRGAGGMYRNLIVHGDDRNGSSWNVTLFDMNTGDEFFLTDSLDDHWSPDIDGRLVVWELDGDLYGYDLGSDERPGTSDDGGYARITETERFEQHPSLHNNVLVFQDWHDGNSVIYARNLTTGQEIQVTKNGKGRHPNVYHDVIVWQDIRNGTDDIYMARLPFGFAGGANVEFSQADFDRDGDVDLADYLTIAAGFSGPGLPTSDSRADLDRDGDVDLADLVRFQSLFTGAK